MIDLAALEEYRSHGSRPAKLANLERGGWQTLVLGDSRSHAAVDALDPVWGGQRVYNASVPSTTVRETEILLRAGLEGSSPERIVLFVQLDSFDQGFEGAHQLFEGRGRTEQRLQDLFGWPTMREAWRVVKLADRGVPAMTRPLGMRRSVDPADTRGSFGRVLAKRRAFAERFTLSEERWQTMERMVAAGRGRGIDVYVAVAPVHATLLESYRSLGLWPQYQEMIRRLASLSVSRGGGSISVWDFSGYAGPPGEPLPDAGSKRTMEWYFEASHFRPQLASMLLAEMFGHETDPPDLGFRLDPASVAADLARLEAERVAYLRDRPGDVIFVHDSTASNERP
jgi:hypothetical protein